MAKSSDNKMYIALGVLAITGGAYFMQQRKHTEEASEHSLAAEEGSLPTISLSEEQLGRVDGLTLSKPEKVGETPSPASKSVLKKSGETWNLVEPVSYLANQKNVESLLKNVEQLTVKERIAPGTESYDAYDLTDDKAIRVVLLEGDKAVLDLYIGKSGGRGQTARIAGTDGVYVLDGFSRFLYERDTKGFRELKVVEVPADQTTKVTIENEHGTFELSKDGESWAGTLKNKPMKEFESSKADDLVRAFATVNATAFGDAETLASAGLETPAATITFGRADGGETKILFGGQTEGTARFAKLPEGAQIYALSSWVSDWAFANEEKFQKKEGEDEAAAPPGGMPPGMGMPGMPMGMPPH